ncbi:unnamed protein product [Protopolystoma xenopodis]|uniref:ENTH domain-containing protein n=1 Tax=Protopolystoma xenopodis TaxID=117903 RepID=A0A448WAC9_9PLAT|nr:unnamed protein product [Protopolystoma xenopodis]
MPIHRHIKNVVHNYTDAERKVREATSNDPWGPSSTLMAEIADKTHNVMAFTEIMQMIWRRLNDKNKNWRHVYKALILLEYIIKTGSDKVAVQCRENIHSIETLRDFEYVEEGKDHGLSVREKARLLSTLLRDEERLREERTKALISRDRLMIGGLGTTVRCSSSPMGCSTTDGGWTSDASPYASTGTGYGQMRNPRGSKARTPPLYDPTTCSPPSSSSEMETARPHSPGEEQLQLQLALAMSKEEHEREVRRRRAEEEKEEAKLQMVMEQSRAQREEEARKDDSTTQPPEPSLGVSGGNLFNLIDTSLSAAPADVPDPWATAIGSTSNSGGSLHAFQDQPFGLTSHPSSNPNFVSQGIHQVLVSTDEKQIISTNGQGHSSYPIQLDDPWASPYTPQSRMAAFEESKLPTMSIISSENNAGSSAQDVWGLKSAFTGPLLEATTNRLWTANGAIMNISSNPGPSCSRIYDSAGTNELSREDDETNGQTKKRTPADFLGEHQGLVDLDKLVERSPRPI